jgi:hypothetical protein
MSVWGVLTRLHCAKLRVFVVTVVGSEGYCHKRRNSGKALFLPRLKCLQVSKSSNMFPSSNDHISVIGLRTT